LCWCCRRDSKDFGQPDLITEEKTNSIGTRERAAIQRLKEISTNGLEKLMKEHWLDAIVEPNYDVSVLAVGGYPGITVPAGYSKQGIPFALSFGGLKGYEPRLIEIAYAFEQSYKSQKRPPTFKR
jgi:amidase